MPKPERGTRARVTTWRRVAASRSPSRPNGCRWRGCPAGARVRSPCSSGSRSCCWRRGPATGVCSGRSSAPRQRSHRRGRGRRRLGATIFDAGPGTRHAGWKRRDWTVWLAPIHGDVPSRPSLPLETWIWATRRSRCRSACRWHLPSPGGASCECWASARVAAPPAGAIASRSRKQSAPAVPPPRPRPAPISQLVWYVLDRPSGDVGRRAAVRLVDRLHRHPWTESPNVNPPSFEYAISNFLYLPEREAHETTCHRHLARVRGLLTPEG